VSNDYPVVAIAGPTASGKSALGLFLADAFRGEIVNYDSIQLFRGLDIGSAKPSAKQRSRVPHHLLDVLDPTETPSAGDYQRRARAVLADIRSRGRLPILVGGTGLYLRAVVEGLFEGPPRSEDLRERLSRLATERGREHLHAVLTRLDPSAADRIASRDTSKVIRALEVRLTTGRSLSSYLESRARDPIEGFRVLIVGLEPPRDALYERIGERVRGMFDQGLVEEVRALLDAGIPAGASAFRGIGYRQAVAHILHGMPPEEAIMLTERDTRRYAKRQMTWFRKQHEITWFGGFGNEEENKRRIRRLIHDFLGGFPEGLRR
jgi:tRNA dimethylallyltransferase